VIPIIAASKIFGTKENLIIFHLSFKSDSISSDKPARHKMTQNAIFLSKDDVWLSTDEPIIETPGTFLKNIPTASIPFFNETTWN